MATKGKNVIVIMEKKFSQFYIIFLKTWMFINSELSH